MKFKNYHLLFVLLISLAGFSNNDKYRLVINNDPATSITIAWNQISGTNPQVHYGTTDFGINWQSYPNVKSVDRQISFRGMDNRFARLTGLTPNTSYYFVIHDSQGTSQRFWFKTSPDDDSRLSFIAGGDSRNNRTPRQRANLLVSKLKPHAVFFGGDMTDDDTSNEWQDWFDDWQLTTANDGRMFPIVAARGNHEYNTSTIYNLFDSPNQDSYFAVTFGNNLIRCYTLNSEISVSGNQKTWLENDLANAGDALWKMAQYHKPMRPHTSGKSEGNDIYSAWAQLFYDEGVNLVVDCDSHMAKTTFPIKPSSGANSDEGFEIDNANGTVYTGEGCWGAPLRSADDNKTWTRNSGSFNQFKLLFVGLDKIELRTIKVDNANQVGENTNNDPFQLPSNLDVFLPSPGEDVIDILPNNGGNPCPDAGTSCDDGDPNTINDVEDGNCNCSGLPQSGTLDITVTEDAEEGESGAMYLSSSDLELVFDSFDSQNNQTVGLRFDNISLPSNANITNAYIQFTVDETSSGATNLTITGDYSGNASSFSSNSNDISNRTTTSSQNEVAWSNLPSWNSVGESNANQRTPNISSVVQEILGHPSWSPTNAMVFIITGTGSRTAEALEGSFSGAARLVIAYTLDGGTTACDSPLNLNASNITSSSVDFNWDSSSNATSGYEWVVMSSGVTPDTSNAVATGSVNSGITLAQVTGLSESTIYDAYVRSDCGSDGLSDWSNSISFSTLNGDGTSNCNAPSNLTTNNITFNSTNVSWDLVSNANNGYTWVAMPNGVSPSTSSAVATGSVNSSTTTANVTGLSSQTTYDIYVRSSCGPSDISTWSNFLTITTLQDNTNCPEAGTLCNDADSSTNFDEEDGNCNCIGIPNTATIAEFPVLTSSDDAEEQVSNGSVNLTSSDLELTFESGSTNQLVGVRFNNIIIPQGKVVHRAYIQFQADNTNSGDTDLVIKGHKITNSSTFTTGSNNISSRTTTNSEVEWNNIPAWNNVGQAGPNERTPNLASIIHEIINTTSWSSGNAFTFIITGTGEREAESINGTAAPILRLVYGDPLPPQNDSPCDAIQLNVDISSTGNAYTLEGATAQSGEPDTNFDNLDGTVWFKFTAPLHGNVQITTDISGGTLNDSEIALYSVEGCNNFSTFTQIGFDQDSATIGGRSVINSYDLDPGETYYVQVDRRNSSDVAGTFGIEVRNLTYIFNSSGYSPFDPSGQNLAESVLIIEEGEAIISSTTTLGNIIVKPQGVLDIDADLTSDIVFESSLLGTAQLDDAEGFSIVGDVTVHRYIPVATYNSRAFRFLTSAVDSYNPIFDNWQEGGATPSGFGTHISGSVTGDNGFDATGTGNPSMFTFEVNINDWSAIPNTDVMKLQAGEGYLMFIRGDRNFDMTSNDPPNSDVILRATGSLVTGPHTQNLSSVEGNFSLVGNPYQAIVDYNLLTNLNINPNFIWVWDPNMGVRGAYVTIIIPLGINTGTSEASQFIQPSQSFFVQTLNNNPASISFTESAKSVTEESILVFNTIQEGRIKILLYAENELLSGKSERDGIIINFNSTGNNNVDQADALKFINFDENLARTVSGTNLSVENRALPIDGETLNIYTSGYTVTDYAFVFNIENLDPGIDAYLIDNFTNDMTLLGSGINQVSFNVDLNDTNSLASDRFSITFENNTLSLNENVFGDEFSLFPIPSKDGLFTIKTVGLNNSEVQISVFDIVGKRLMTNSYLVESNGEVNVNASHLSQGVYIVELEQENKKYTTKLIIE